MIVRFEMPVNVWCDGCGEHIARGVRYNAEKKQCGMYFSSEVFEFQMNCHICGQRFIIKTDPQNRDYEFVSGLHRKAESFDTKETGTMSYDPQEQALMRTDAIRSLENKEEDNLRSEKLAPTLDQLKSIEENIRSNEDVLNRRVRDKLRIVRKAEKRREDLAAKEGLSIKLLPTSRSDIRSSRSVLFRKKSKADVNAKLLEIKATSDVFARSDPMRDRTLKQCIANGVDLSLFKKKEEKKEDASLPRIVLKKKGAFSSEGVVEKGVSPKIVLEPKESTLPSQIALKPKENSPPETTVEKKTQTKNTLGLVPLSYGASD